MTQLKMKDPAQWYLYGTRIAYYAVRVEPPYQATAVALYKQAAAAHLRMAGCAHHAFGSRLGGSIA
jgi:hypothetical protein